MFLDFNELKEVVRSQKKVRLAVSAADDRTILEAVKLAVDENLVEPILVGNENKINQIAKDISLSDYTVLNCDDNTAELAVKLVRQGKADILMKGLINTSDFLRAVLNRDFGLRTNSLLSMLAVFQVPQYHKLIFTSDSGVNVAPNIEDKKKIVYNTLNAMKNMGFDNPKVAILSSNEQVSEKIPSTVDASILVEMSKKEEFPMCQMEGPMAFDVAFDPKAALHKGIKSEISGDVDVLIFPNIETGNILTKSWIHFNKASWAGIVLGATAPIVLGSRSDSPNTKLNSIALACLTINKGVAI